MHRYVDADGHAVEPRDLFRDNLPKSQRDDAVAVVWNPETEREMVVGEGKIILEAGVAAAGCANRSWADWCKGIRYDPEVLVAGGFDPAARLVDMEQHGIDLSFIFPTLGLTIGGIQDPKLAAAHARIENDWIAEYCGAFPDALAGIATVALQDVQLAIDEARRAVQDLGMRGLFIRPNPYGDRHVHSPEMDPFWAAAQELGVPVCLHPGGSSEMWGFSLLAEKFPVAPALGYGFALMFGFDMQYAWSLMVGGGVLDRFPDLKVGLMETGGGWMAHWMVRMDHVNEVFEWTEPKLAMKPSEYFARNGYIAFDPDEPTLAGSIDIVGADRILWASDYPHQDLRSECVRDDLDTGLAGVAEEDKRLIIEQNALDFYSFA